jgi:hypothetical protein
VGNRFTQHHALAGGTDDWITPPGIIEALGPFDLDPCASVGQPWPCATNLPGHLICMHGDRRPQAIGWVWQ